MPYFIFFYILILIVPLPPPMDDHERCRGLVCVVCYKKGNRTISENETKYIRENLIDGFAIDNPAAAAFL